MPAYGDVGQPAVCVADGWCRRGRTPEHAISAIPLAACVYQQSRLLGERGVTAADVHADGERRDAGCADVHRERGQDRERERGEWVGEPVGHGGRVYRGGDVQLPVPVDRADKPACAAVLGRECAARRGACARPHAHANTPAVIARRARV